MIHLDRNHNELSPTQNSNLILPESHNPSNILQWQQIPHDPKFQDNAHEKYFQDVSETYDSALTDDKQLTEPVTRTSSPHDPRDDKSSSLSPAPGSPQQDRKTPPPPSPSPNAEPADKTEGDGTFSRQLTPLTDLSPAPDYDDGEADTKDTDENKESPDQKGEGEEVSKDKAPHINGTKSSSRPDGSSSSRQPSTATAPQNLSKDQIHLRSGEKPASAVPSHMSRPPSHEPMAASIQSLVPGLSTENLAPGASDSKVVRILELNAELLKVCMEFQMRAMPITESRFQQYAMRLQTNLTWLAAAADQRHGANSLAFPIMEPPITLDFISTDRIQELYADLPTIFAKDIARRQSIAAQHNGSPSASSAPPNGHLKRNRPDDIPDPMSKRRDMGDTKSQSMQPPAVPSISISGAASRSSPTNPFAPSNNTVNLSVPRGSTPQSPRISSPTSMAPPSLTASLPFGVTEAQIAANSRNRAREIQIHQARELQQRTQAQAQMQQMQAAQRISPPTASPQPPQQLPGQNMQANSAAGPSSMQGMNPMVNQQLLILRNPSHPLMQYITSQLPGFTSLPVPQQLQKLTAVQMSMASRQMAVEQQRNAGQMPGMPQAGMPNMANGAMSGMNHSGGRPNPISPHTQNPSDMSQQMHSQSPQNAMFSFNQGQNNPSMDPRMAASNFTPQGQANMDMTQRQMLMMQQQMRGANGNVNPQSMMTPQQQAAYMQQRMSQGPSSQHGGSPMSAPGNDSFPALRSNSAIPGIARSGRSPTDGVHSPMTPRAPSRLSQQQQIMPEEYQRMMMQQSQANGMGSGVNQQQHGGYNPQMQGNPNWQQSGQHAQMGQMNGFGMSPQGSAGISNPSFGGVPSPSSQGWPQQQQGGANGYPYGSSMGQRHPSEQARTPRNMSGTPAPQNISPTADNSGTGDLDLFNWNGQ
ncbi:hypothetical protein BJ138DRAFT_789316 [Hygrophoropsis aurantiaca]|uniref:Uncharacterized protein n=1 Tax=Hygrophoropsis aurantiaca TaxID=72124 RepID=A0ACB8AGH4_9AGAM|nr:hypothetical protein BJ138DRAFT_789316 [Hygrophoropsis aurantiaca]